MKLKNTLFLALVQAGVDNLKTTTLPAKSAYKAIKFRREVMKVIESLRESEMSLLSSCNVELDANGLAKGEESNIVKYNEMHRQLLVDESEIGEVQTISFDDWRALQSENKGLVNAAIEDALEDVLWRFEDEGE